jgi:hypothetical protein
MDVFSTELGIRLSFVKTLELFWGGFEPTKPLPLVRRCSLVLNQIIVFTLQQNML